MNKFDPKNIKEYFENEENQVPLDIAAFHKHADESLTFLEHFPLSPNNPHLTESIRLNSK